MAAADWLSGAAAASASRLGPPRPRRGSVSPGSVGRGGGDAPKRLRCSRQSRLRRFCRAHNAKTPMEATGSSCLTANKRGERLTLPVPLVLRPSAVRSPLAPPRCPRAPLPSQPPRTEPSPVAAPSPLPGPGPPAPLRAHRGAACGAGRRSGLGGRRGPGPRGGGSGRGRSVLLCPARPRPQRRVLAGLRGGRELRGCSSSECGEGEGGRPAGTSWCPPGAGGGPAWLYGSAAVCCSGSRQCCRRDGLIQAGTSRVPVRELNKGPVPF